VLPLIYHVPAARVAVAHSHYLRMSLLICTNVSGHHVVQ